LKGKLLGRAKKRDSVLIRKLLDAGLSYRNIAGIAKCSHGSVHAEVVQYKKEKTAAALKKAELDSSESVLNPLTDFQETSQNSDNNSMVATDLLFPKVA
jgi:hypothetical protein